MNTHASTIEINQVIKNLVKVAIPKEQAKAIAKEITQIHINNYPEKMLKINLEHIMAIVEARIERLRSDLFKWNISIVFTQMLGILLLLMER